MAADYLNRPRPPVVTPGPERRSPPPPSDAFALLKGRSLSAWRSQEGAPAG
jgi:hypothetical protein